MSYIDSVNVGGTPYKIQETSYIAPSLSGTAYTAALANFTLATGATVQAKFSVTNPAEATLNINSTGAKNIFYNNAKIIANQFKANHTYSLVYDGTQWQLVGDIDTNTQTVTGVKGNSESNYRTGNVNITATNIGLGNVENTKLSTWTGSTNITTLGTITTGTWNGTAIANNKLVNSSLTVGNKSINLGASGTVDEIITYSTTIGQNTSWDITNSGAYPAYYSGGFSGDQNPSTNQNAPYSYGTLYVMRANTAGAAQFYISHHASSSKNAANGIRYRSGWDVTNTEKTVAQRWEAWATILDDKNYNLYSPKLDGTGATGSWGINITGSAGSVAWANTGHPDTFPPTIGTTATTAAAGNHTHTISLTQTGTSTVNLAANTVYTLTAGGSSIVFKTPADGNTDTKVTQAYSTSNSVYPILMTATAGNASTASRGDTTAILNNNIYANPSTGVIYSSAHVTNALGKTNNWIAYPDGGTYSTSAATITGALKIKLPQVNKNTMMSFDVNIYTYEGDNATSCVYHISGYEYSANGWHNPVCRVYSEGTGAYTNLTVRFGAENNKAYVTIGETNTVWSYPQVAISNILTGYSNHTFANWGTGWSISFTTTLPSTSTGSRTDVNTQSINITGTAGRVAWANVSEHPTKLSQFTNDSGYITDYTETDPTVPAWAKAATKPSYNWSEINNKPDVFTPDSHTHGNITNDGKKSGSTVSGAVTTSHKFLREDGEWVVPKYTTNTDTHRVIKVNDNQILASNTTALNLKAGENITITATANSGDITITAIDTTYESKAAASNGTAESLVTTGEKYIWNNKQNALSFDGTYSTNNKVATVSTVSNIATTNGAISASTLRERLGLSTALRFMGITTTDMTNGTATNHTYTGKPAGISNYTPVVGDVVINSTKQDEWVCTAVSGTTYTWERLGSDTSYKIVQSAVSDPAAASTTSTTFIDTISQNANGVISATKKTLPTASTSVAGIIKIGTGSTNAMAGNTTVTNVSYTAAAATDDHEYPILMKNSTGSTTTAAGVKFANVTNKAVTINPANGTITAQGGFYGSTFSGTANKANYLRCFELAENDDLNLIDSHVDEGILQNCWVGGGIAGSIQNRPDSYGVASFGMLAFKIATNWTGQILLSTNQAPGLYWRSNNNSSSPAYGAWARVWDSSNHRVFYGTCTEAAGTATKAVGCANYDGMKVGDIITVKFDNTNTAASPTLNVNGKGSKSVKMAYSGGTADLSSYTQLAGIRTFIYDGINWILQEGECVKQGVTDTTSDIWRPVMLGAYNSTDVRQAPEQRYAMIHAARNVKYHQATGTLRAPILKTPKLLIEQSFEDKAYIEWNEIDKSIDFIFMV